MRRALVKRLPSLTRFYGLRPVDLDDMNVREMYEYLRQLDKAEADAEGRSRA